MPTSAFVALLALAACPCQGVRFTTFGINFKADNESVKSEEHDDASAYPSIDKKAYGAEPICSATPPTYYDAWTSTQPELSQKISAKDTLIFVIDMQVDFVYGSFQQPCLSKREYLTSKLESFVKTKFAKGATVVASLDWHPESHCGVTNDCKNEHGPFARGKPNASIASETFYSEIPGAANRTGRYKNQFPPHCEFKVSRRHTIPKGDGAKFFPPIGQMLKKFAQTDYNRVHTVFKGFNREKDSFSAMPMFTGSGVEVEEFTGGYEVIPDFNPPGLQS